MKNNPNSQSPIPNSNKLVFLIGMPAVGKTYWAGKIAERHKLEFIDLDVFVSLQEKASISALFAQYGEKGFRERENKQLKKLIGAITVDTVVACGGGTPCFHDNMELMKNAGVVIYLSSDIPFLLKHIKNSAEDRPLLNNRGDLSVYLEKLLRQRKEFYEQAHHILQTKNISITTFDKIIK